MRENWEIKFPEQIVVDDIIVHDQRKFIVNELIKSQWSSPGGLGECTLTVRAKPYIFINSINFSDYIETFWLNEHEPIPTLKRA